MCIKPKKWSSLSFKKCSRIKRSLLRKIRHEDFVNDIDYEDENADDYDATVAVMVVVAVVVEVTKLPAWRQ